MPSANRLPTTSELAQAISDVEHFRRSMGDSGNHCIEDASPGPGRLMYLDETRLFGGSFKMRPAVAVVLDAIRNKERSLILPSSGNFGLTMAAVNASVRRNQLKVTVVTPASCPATKREPMEALGAEVLVVDGEFDEAALYAAELGKARGVRVVSPDNDAIGIAGAATAMFDIARRIDHVAAFNTVSKVVIHVAFVGGGSLAGIKVGLDYLQTAGHMRNVELSKVTLPDTWNPTRTPSFFDTFAGLPEPGSVAAELSSGIKLKTVTFADIRKHAAWLVMNDELAVEATAAASYAAADRAASENTDPDQIDIAVLTSSNINRTFFAELSDSPYLPAGRQRIYGLAAELP